jgi:hypothetical protein
VQTDTNSLSPAAVLAVQNMPPYIREGMIRVIRWVDLRMRIEALETYKREHEGADSPLINLAPCLVASYLNSTGISGS